MKRSCFLYLLAGIFLLCTAPHSYATDTRGDLESEPDIKINSEDQKVIALMELLQKMEMLTDLDMIAAGEVKK
jgi:hypothetical protein